MDLKSLIISLAFLLYAFGPCFSQESPITIRIQIIDVNTKKGIEQTGVHLSGKSSTTDNNGFVRITLPKGVQVLELQTPAGYEINSPPGPTLPVPNSENAVVQFWVKTAAFEKMQEELNELRQEKNNLTSRVGNLSKELDSMTTNYENLSSNSQVLEKTLTQLSKSIKGKDLLIDSLKQKSDSIENRMGEYKRVIFKKISTNYKRFHNDLLDMELNLINIKNAFINPGEVDLFNKKIDSLNSSRNALDEEHMDYVKTTKLYWNKEAAVHLDSLYDIALINIYERLIIPLNKVVIQNLNDAWQGEKCRMCVQRKTRTYLKKTTLGKLRKEIEDMEQVAEKVLSILSKSD